MSESKQRGSRDVALLYAPTEDGQGARILRTRDGNLEAGEVRPVKDGQPLGSAELVKLEPRPGATCLYDVEVLHAASTRQDATSRQDAAAQEPSRSASTGRPAQVATEDYRLNWDRVFGAPKAKGDSSLN